MNKKTFVVGSVILAIIFAVLAIVYWVTPSGSLPHFMPGFQEGGTNIHFKHGLASFMLALALCAYAWFASAPKSK